MGGHGGDDGRVCRADVDDEARKSGRHAERLGHIQGLLGVVAAAAVEATGAGAVGREQNRGDGEGLADVLVVGIQVGEIGAFIFEEAKVLTCAGERRAAVVCCAHVAAEEGRRRAGAGGGVLHDLFRLDAVGGCVVALFHEQGMRDGEVVEAGDVPESEGQVGRGLAIRAVKGAIFGRVPIGVHGDVEGAFYRGNGAFDLHIHAIARTAGDGEAARREVAYDGFIVLFGGAEHGSEFGGCEPVAIGGTGGVVELVEVGVQRIAIPQGKDDIQLQNLVGREASEGLSAAIESDFAHVVGQDGLGLACDRGGKRHQDDGEHGKACLGKVNLASHGISCGRGKSVCLWKREGIVTTRCGTVNNKRRSILDGRLPSGKTLGRHAAGVPE